MMLEIPDRLFKRAKLKALQEGVTLNEVINRALARYLGWAFVDGDARSVRANRLFAAMDQARNKQPVGRLNRAEFHDRPVLR